MSDGLHADVRVGRAGGFRLDLRLHLPAGRTTALLGPNGAGKSTAVRALAGLLPIDEGRIELAGSVLDDPSGEHFVPPRDRRVGVVFQDGLLLPHLSALDNVAFGPLCRGRSPTEARRTAAGWLERLAVGGLQNRRPAELSGGQAQRVALARALAAEPRLLLLDEPMAALDVTTRTTMRGLLGEHLADFEGPRMLITHDPAEAFLLADTVVVLEEGQVTQEGAVEDILLRPRTPYVADLAGMNFVRGVAAGGVVDVDGHEVHIADHDATGPVVVTIRPAAISVHTDRPTGSFRNRWPTTVRRIEALGHRVRLLTGGPLALTVEVTREASSELGLRTGSEIWLAIKATEIGVQAGGSPVVPRARGSAHLEYDDPGVRGVASGGSDSRAGDGGS